VEQAVQPQWRAEHIKPTTPPQRAAIETITLYYFPIFYGAALVLVFAARGVRALIERRRGSITVSYPGRKVRTPRGLTLLETSMRFKVPHASVCGGKARCSTCRVRVVSDRAALPPPSGRETFVLTRVGASANPSIRLACQLRPRNDISVIPVLPANVGADFVRNRGRINIGQEHYVVSMFIDMRGSTRLAETRLPFDTVFLINRFLEAASQAVIDAGGHLNQFVGDGLLALFGLDSDPAVASRQAIRAAAMVASNVAYLNHEFASEPEQPIGFGIGIHGGEVIVGDIGFRDKTVFTALGDPVNVAARLQDMTKAHNCSVIISEEVYRRAGISTDQLVQTEVSIRGRDQAMTVCIVAEPTMLAGLLDEQIEPLAAE
jgi:adenylate cyclase